MKKILSFLAAASAFLFSAFIALAAASIPGDVDLNGTVEVNDALLALEAAVSSERFSPLQLENARVLGNSEVSSADARFIFRMSNRLSDYEIYRNGAVETVLRSMSPEQKISQMLMPAFRNFNGAPVTELNNSLGSLFADCPFAGVILFAPNIESAGQTVSLTDSLQRANAVGNRPQLFICADQEGGKITRLQTGSQTPGNMALGAAGERALSQSAADIIGTELKSVGINVDFAPVLDINSNPSNPVIGVRSFSDDPFLTAEMGKGYISGLQGSGVVSTLKHFPGHGDTATDSHTGLPRIDKTLEQLRENELVPFKACVDAGAEMIMTAHIQFPLIESGTYVSKRTGEPVYLPATLSETIITGILRDDMGFEGVVVTDAMNMDAIASHFYRLDAARLAINAGVDILLIPVDLSSDAGISDMKNYISDVAAMISNGDISAEKVDKAVRRILKLKYEKGMFSEYELSDIEKAVENAKATLGSVEHHTREWLIAKKAVTMVKNDGGTLPVRPENKKVVLLAAAQNEILSLNYALDVLKSENRLPESAKITTACYTGMSVSELISTVSSADYVLAVSEVSSAAALDPGRKEGYYGSLIDRMIAAVHENGGRFILLSANLPYDAARFINADAILLCWSDKGMSEDPRVSGNEITGYGPNIPAAVHSVFSPDDGPQGKLPVNIPKLNTDYSFSSEVLWEFGFGLTY